MLDGDASEMEKGDEDADSEDQKERVDLKKGVYTLTIKGDYGSFRKVKFGEFAVVTHQVTGVRHGTAHAPTRSLTFSDVFCACVFAAKETITGAVRAGSRQGVVGPDQMDDNFEADGRQVFRAARCFFVCPWRGGGVARRRSGRLRFCVRRFRCGYR